MTFDEVLEDFKIYASTRHKKQGYITIYKTLNNHILPYFQGSLINSITTKDIINWQNNILSKNYSNKFNSIIYYSFNTLFNYCFNCNYVSENLVSKVGSFPKRIEFKEHKVYNLYQFIWFRMHLNNFVIKQYFNFMFFYGTRPGEAMALRFSDVHGLKVLIQHNIHRKGKRELDTPKNQSSIRIIKINLLMKLRFWLLKRFYGMCDNDYFIFGGSKPLAPTTIDRHKKSACDRANLFVISQHDFRHSYATRMINRKVPINQVSKSMGHSRISTTLDVYTH